MSTRHDSIRRCSPAGSAGGWRPSGRGRDRTRPRRRCTSRPSSDFAQQAPTAGLPGDWTQWAASYRSVLGALGVELSLNSPNARRRDFLYALSDHPARRVGGEKLGRCYGKQALEWE